MEYTYKIAMALQVVGLMNIQFVVKDEKVYIIEVNPRASRTVPILSKVTKIPMVKIAMQVILGDKLTQLPYGIGLSPTSNLIAVKAPVFSFVKLAGVDAALTPEMKSTGEVLGVDTNYEKALLKAFLGAGFKFKTKGKVLVSVADSSKEEVMPYVKELIDLGFEIIASKGTDEFFKSKGLESSFMDITELTSMQTMLKNESLVMVINVPTKGKDVTRDGYKLRNLAEHLNVSSFTCLDTVEAYLTAMKTYMAGEDITYDTIDAYM
jgi:carbamoyl-phosphate synthase large subunit